MKSSFIYEKMLGEDKFRELINYTLQKIRKKFGNIKIDEAIEIENKNHEDLYIIALLKVYKYKDNEIKKVLGWKCEKDYKTIIANSFDEFIDIYKEYLNLMIESLKERIKKNK